MTITPLQDRVLIKPSDSDAVTKGGIIIPDSAKEKPLQGIVVAVGNGRIIDNGNQIPLQVKVNDKVLYGKFSGTEINIDGEEHLMMRESDIFAIINK